MDTSNLPKSFDDLIQQADLPVLVDFWAAWCGPCRMVSPAIEKIAKEFKGRLITVKINVDEKQHVAAKYQITNIPTIMLFKDGQIAMQLAGARPYEALKEEIVKYI